ncbi:hypothetical protein [Mycolicibacterium chubuense]|uniref:Uncharacterized protein n=1 Tax=Mycolicibacterium chubuense TaxID=1800 RepID=A0A0J6VTL1_MYCCU|nr:hypothetical protein [Mycolicibacterium chubuense]KMO72818.1 hypothetical protein MCHUDSM44219_04805 [Mycolicibacterium chubuense]SPX99676.1 Uncharacterised protein [Mycolicibacterium chubuense]
MKILRIALVVAGLAVGAYGAVLLLDQPPVVLVRIAVWAAAAVILHDFVFAPLCAALGFAGRRLVPAAWRTPVAVAALCSVVLALLAIPVYDKPGARPDNLTVLDRDYVAGLWIALAVVWVCVPVYLLVARRLPVRQDQVVDGQRADDVEGQPPAV